MPLVESHVERTCPATVTAVLEMTATTTTEMMTTRPALLPYR
jgi:hypothetical protein